jgi:NADH:ubiquinone oxidoreductase subunit
VRAVSGTGGLMFKRFFIWWSGATLGAFYDIGRRATEVGTDEQGNKYYQERKASRDGRPRRYVTYNGIAEASRVSPDWHGWLHYTFEDPPTVSPLKRQPWELPHRPNLTGTVMAYRPPGSLARSGNAERMDEYEAWRPEGS